MPVDIEKLGDMFVKGKDFQPSISSIVFPRYKNISPHQEICFDFPLTLLVGKNGTNKSSILHALYGCPDGKSTGEYWFSTHVDEISSENRQSYFYRYRIPNTDLTAEVLKTMIKKDGNPEYWEPSRPILNYGMKKMDDASLSGNASQWRSKTRWNAIDKNVLYLDFRAEISAFDKAFYKDQHSSGARVFYRDKLRRWSKNLKNAINGRLKSKIHYGKERIFRNSAFSSDAIDHVNKILGSEYNQIVYVEHDFYHSKSFSVYLKSETSNNYSEAFAGSGETSVVRLVYALENVDEKSLILLDEPETSLHIEAQYRLKEFLIEKIAEKKLQVIMSTHSPFFAKGLPDNAIKILSKNPISHTVEIINSAPADESSFYLGFRRSVHNKVIVYVEDKLAKAICEYVASNYLTPSETDLFEFCYYPGGKDELLKLAATEAMKNHSNTTFLFDGDCKPKESIPDPDTIPSSEDQNLEDMVQKLFGVRKLHFPQNSNQPEQKTSNLRTFLKFAHHKFEYLPFDTPEQFLVNNSDSFQKTGNQNKDPKKEFERLAKEKLGASGDVKSEDILTFQRLVLSSIGNDNQELSKISDTLKKFSAFVPDISN